MPEKQNAGASDAGTPSSSANHGLDDFQDRAKEAGRKQDLAALRLTIGEIMTALGDAEHDDEHRRRHREFLVRFLEEPIQAVGIALPPSAGGEYRVMVRFRAEPASVPYFIGTDFVRAGLLAARVRRLNDCPLHIGPAWEAEASQ